MDSPTPNYENVNSDSIVHFRNEQAFDDVHFTNQLLMQLIRTVDVKELLSIFYRHIKHTLPVESISLGGEDISFSVGASHCANSPQICLKVVFNKEIGSTTPAIHYNLSRRLAASERKLLLSLHNTFSHPVSHALCFSRLTQLARKDTLTGLGNRASFNEDIESIMQSSLRNKSRFGLLVVDLDDFKSVNDGYGHDEGDNVLVSFASVLNASLRANEKAYRFGGDEFCCLLDTDHSETINKVAQRILANAANSLPLQRHGVTASIGGTLSMNDESVTHTFKRADKALYDVKQQGKQGYFLC